MLPLSDSDIQNAAEAGLVVVINSSAFRCDAILVESHQVTSVPLPRYNSDDLQYYLTSDTLQTTQALEWLWDCLAEPVLHALGITSPHPEEDGSTWPHVWWILPGLLSKVPIHAAGHHTDGSRRTVLDRVISSYNTSVSSIVRSRHRQASPILPSPHSSKVLLLPMGGGGGAKGFSDLPSVATEISSIKATCKRLSMQPVVLAPNKQDVLSQLPSCHIFHFAGHGSSNFKNPLQSYLALSMHADAQHSIFVKELLDISLHKSRPLLAYLSACGTGRIRNSQFTDESIHLISGFLLAGFRHVIGTMWDVQDDICAEMATLTYEGMAEQGFADSSVAWDLHSATRTLKDRWIQSLGLHTGSKRTSELRHTSLSLAHEDSKSHDKETSHRDILAADDDYHVH